MKKTNTSNNNSTKPSNANFAVNKTEVVRRATQVALTQFSKTFADLARYDRTETKQN